MLDSDTIRTIAAVVGAIGQTAFVILYLTFPWWKTFLGRALFAKALFFSMLLNAAAFTRVFGPWEYEQQAFITMYCLLAFGIWWQVIAFFRTKMRHEDRPAVEVAP